MNEIKRPIRRLVVKVGTANLCDKSGRLVQGIFDDLSRQIIELMMRGIEVLIVSSGAIKAGRERLQELGMSDLPLHKKDIAGVGARHLMNMWGEPFELRGREVAQIWVTYGNWTNPGEKKSIKSSLVGYLSSKSVIPIVNEADVISDREIKLMERGFSENDRLARMIAFLIRADAILFLTDSGGIYDGDPEKDSAARMYKEISAMARPKSIGVSQGTSGHGTGGMLAKCKEASACARKGMQVAIAGNEKDVILRFVSGEPVGTKIGIATKLKQRGY